MRCYIILHIPEYIDYLQLAPLYRDELFDVDAAKFDSSNVEGLIYYVQNVLEVDAFDIYWTILDSDHFSEIHNIK